jgi:hypothetical protein
LITGTDLIGTGKDPAAGLHESFDLTKVKLVGHMRSCQVANEDNISCVVIVDWLKSSKNSREKASVYRK